ncbi:hypothetical protein LPJ71_002018 [Coemansia sp. S17]|nr:hypothetical protein LPJ71_002018 [Coemansia sp. S17]
MTSRLPDNFAGQPNIFESESQAQNSTASTHTRLCPTSKDAAQESDLIAKVDLKSPFDTGGMTAGDFGQALRIIVTTNANGFFHISYP